MTSKFIEPNTQSVINGVEKAVDIITSTMGGKGKNVLLSSDLDLVFTKDGVSVADHLKFENNIENLGARLVIDAANKTVEQCGDGTTLTCLFTSELIKAFKAHINNDNLNELIEQLDDFIINYEKKLIEQSTPVDSFEKIYQIAKTSAKSGIIGNLIKEIYEQVGFDASISVEKSRTSNYTYYEISNGLQYDSGFINSRFANQENGNCIFDNCHIITENSVVSSPTAYVDVLGEIANRDESVVIIAPHFSDSFIRFALTNKSQKGLKICLIKTPGYGEAINENYKDIQAFTNNSWFTNKIVITPYSFTIYNNPDIKILNKRINTLQKLADNAVEPYDEEKYLNSITKLKQSGAIIYVGGITERNIKEEFDRIEDAVGAVKSALKTGYVRGAGCELVNIANELPNIFVNDVLKAPIHKILSNANITKTNLKFDKPYNVILKDYDDTVIDPSYVLINSFKNAAALVKLLINTSYIIYNE